MAEIRIWYKHATKAPEVIDRAYSQGSAAYLVHEYRLAFGLLPGQFRHGKDHVWSGKRSDGPTGTYNPY